MVWVIITYFYTNNVIATCIRRDHLDLQTRKHTRGHALITGAQRKYLYYTGRFKIYFTINSPY